MAVARAKLEPFTVPHFIAYGERLVLDTGDTWHIEDFQVDVVAPILGGIRETWVLLPECNAKTTLMATMALYHADYTPSPWVPIGASSRDQAEILFMQAAEIVRSMSEMVKRFRVYEGLPQDRCRYATVVETFAGFTPQTRNTGDGVIPTLALLDEGAPSPGSFALTKISGRASSTSAMARSVMISTAGVDPGSEFEEAT